MANIVVGLYRTETEVKHVLDDLTDHDFPRRKIEVHRAPTDDLRSWLIDRGVPAREADDYVDGVRNGGELVTLELTDGRTSEAVEIMRRHEGEVPPGAAAATAGTVTEDRAARVDTDREVGETARTRTEGDQVIEVAEEELSVGKREVEHPVRVRTYVTEKPVEETVELRDETVEVERRPADRPVDAADDAFQEKTVEMTETDEEVVVDKRARVIEEVVLSKDVTERTETVRDTVRRTEVEVDEGGVAREETAYVFDDDRDYFREHYRTTFTDTAYEYDDYERAYRYGSELAAYPDYRGRAWSEVSSEAHERWEARNPGTWDDFEPAVRHGYERARARS